VPTAAPVASEVVLAGATAWSEAPRLDIAAWSSPEYSPRKLITGVTVFDVYEGKGIDETRKSIAIAVTIQPREKTMTDEEIDAVGAKIVAEVAKKTGGTLRA